MKVFMIIILCCLMQYNGKAQLVEEWLRQKETQKKYLLQQIVALQVYASHVKKGYRIANEGMNSISAIKNGEWKLHKSFFQSLQKVSPAVKGYSKIADILLLQAGILREYKNIIIEIKATDLLSSGEVDYIYRVMASLLDKCTDSIEDLTDVITPGIYELSDDGRIRCIDDLYAAMLEQHSFTESFSAEIKLLVLQKNKEKKDIEMGRILHEEIE